MQPALNVEIVVTAPRKANAQVLLKQAPTPPSTHGTSYWSNPSNEEKWLIIDEAAGIPLWATETLRKIHAMVISDNGVGLRRLWPGLCDSLSAMGKTTLSKGKNHQLNTPMRWPLNDPLEQWLTDCFLMDESTTRLPDPELADGQFLEHAADMRKARCVNVFSYS